MKKHIIETHIPTGYEYAEFHIITGAVFRHAEYKVTSVYLYFEVVEKEPLIKEKRAFQIVSTHQGVDLAWEYLASLKMHSSNVLHVYEVKSAKDFDGPLKM